MERLYSMSDLAERLGESVRTIKYWRTRGILPPPMLHDRRTLRWGESQMDDWEAEMKETLKIREETRRC